MSCLWTLFRSIKQGLEYILLFKGGIVYLIYLYSHVITDKNHSLVPNDILMLVGFLGLVAYFINPLELRKRKGENPSVSNSYSGMAQLYLMFTIMIAQYYSQDQFYEFIIGGYFKTVYFWICFIISLVLLYWIQIKFDEPDYSSYNKYKKDPNFKKILKLSFIPFIFTAVMTSYISAYCINYKLNSSLPQNISFEIEKIYDVKTKSDKGEVITYHAELKTEYPSIKKISVSIEEFKNHKTGDVSVFPLYKGYLGVPYIGIDRKIISKIE